MRRPPETVAFLFVLKETVPNAFTTNLSHKARY